MRLLLSETLPLRTSAMLGNVAELFVLPQRYGDLTSGRFALGRLNDTTFFVADHPMPVGDVFVDGQKTKSWARELRHDDKGNTWTVVVLTAPAPTGASLSATGTGKRNAKTGALIENPADIVEDILKLAGRTDMQWDGLRAECSAAGIRLAGSVDSALSIRATIDAVLGSAGAIWTTRAARLYPIQTVSGIVRALDNDRASSVSASANLDNSADILRLYYDPDVGSTAQHFIELTASPQRYGGIVREVTLAWLRTPANAEAVGRRILAWLAAERYTVPFNCQDLNVRACDWITLENHPEWPIDGGDPTIMVRSVAITPGEKNIECEGETLVTTPTITVTGHSVALPTTRDAGVDIAVQNGVATFVVTDTNDKPIFGALVGIDGGAPKTTDATGSVRFPAKPGQHKLAIKAPGKISQTLTILL